MRIFVTSVFAVIVIAEAAIYMLSGWQRSSYQAFSSEPSVRISEEEAGHNLVGKDWNSAREY